MFRLRRALPWVALLSLVLQAAIGGVSLSAMALAHGPDVTTTCTCFHGADGHGQCPMHHSESGRSRCRVRGMDDQASSALASLLTPLAAPSTAAVTVAAPVESGRPTPRGASPLGLAASPDLPPPRS